MKALLICGSLVANVALIATVAFRPSLAPPAMRDFFRASASAAPTSLAAPARAEPAKPAPKVWAQLDSTDLHTLVKRLQAAGFPSSIIRSIIGSLVDTEYAAKMRDLMAPDPNTPFWRLQSPYYTSNDKRYAEMQRLRRERSNLLRDITRDLPGEDADVTAYQRRRYGNLAPATIEALQRVEDDYNEMTSAVRAGMHGIELKQDRDALALLAQEKHADLAAILTPDQLAEYEMRTSMLTQTLRSRLGTFASTEAEYRSIFQAYQAVGQSVTKTGSALMMDQAMREDAEQKLASTLQGSLGDARYQQFLRATGQDYQQLTRMAQQQNLPPDTADRALAIRDAAAKQSVEIAQDPAMAMDDKRAALKTLAENTRLQLDAVLPGETGPLYAKRASWLGMLDHGMAFSVTAKPPLIVANDTGGTTSFSGSMYQPVPLRRGGRQ